MEIDFLGLNSRKYSMEQEGSQNVFMDAANEAVETSLSLSSSSSLDSHKEILNISEKNKTWESQACDKMIPSSSGSTLCSLAPYNHENSTKIEQPGLLLVATPAFHQSAAAAAAAGFLYDLNNAASTNFRNLPLSPPDLTTASLRLLYPPCPTPKAEKTICAGVNASTRLSGGYTPTVAMARRATLARFLEKRLHRMNQGRTSPIMGKSLLNASNSEACETTIAKSNKKRNNNNNLRKR